MVISARIRARPEIILIPFTLLIAVFLGYVTASLRPFFVLGSLLAILLAIFIFSKPVLGIFLIAFFLPFERIGSYDFAGITIRISQVIAIVTIIGWLYYNLNHKSFLLRKNPLFLPLVIFLLINLASLTNAENLERSIVVLGYTSFTILVSLIIPQIVTKKEQAEKIVNIIIISAFLVGIFGIFQFLGDTMGLPQSLTGLRDLYTKKVLGFPRIQSTALEPLYFANYLLIPLGLICSLFLSRRLKIHYLYLLLLIILIGTNLVLTVSRGGYLAFAALLLTLVFFYPRYIFTPKKIIFLIIAGFIVAYVAIRFLGLGNTLNLETFQKHVVNVFYGAAYNERVEMLDTAMTGFRQHPLIGIGVGAFGPFASAQPYLPPPEGWRIVNNEYIELLTEVGFLGFLSFLVVISIIFFRSLKAIQITKDKYLKAIMIGLVATFIGFLVQYQTFSILYIMHIWFLFGLMISVQNIIFEKS